jgi:hypothetical protein
LCRWLRRQIGQLWQEGCGEIIAARLDQNQIELRKFGAHLGDRGEVDRCVLANRSVGAPSGFNSGDAFCCTGAQAHQVFGVPFGVDVVGDTRDIEPIVGFPR